MKINVLQRAEIRNGMKSEEKKLDKHEEQKFVDDIPMEDLKIEAQDEKKKTKSKDDSQSERKYKKERGF